MTKKTFTLVAQFFRRLKENKPLRENYIPEQEMLCILTIAISITKLAALIFIFEEM